MISNRQNDNCCSVFLRVEGSDQQRVLELAGGVDGLDELHARVAELFGVQLEAVRAIRWDDEITTDKEVRRLSDGSRLACMLNEWQQSGASAESGERRMLVGCAENPKQRHLMLNDDATQVIHLKAAAVEHCGLQTGVGDLSVFLDDEEGSQEVGGDREVRRLADGTHLGDEALKEEVQSGKAKDSRDLTLKAANMVVTAGAAAEADVKPQRVNDGSESGWIDAAELSLNRLAIDQQVKLLFGWCVAAVCIGGACDSADLADANPVRLCCCQCILIRSTCLLAVAVERRAGMCR